MKRDNEVLERRYRRLLLAYPAAYRRQRGTEMLDTLLHQHPGQRWPSTREAWALLSGGLRVRSGISQPMSLQVSLRQVGLLAALLTICGRLVLDLTALANIALLQHAMSWSAFVSGEWWSVVETIGYAWAAVLVCRRRPALAIAALAIPTAMTGYSFARFGGGWDLAMDIVVAAVLSATVSRRRLPPLPGGWLWLIGMSTAASVAWSIIAEATNAGLGAWQVASLAQAYGPWLLVAVWTIIDGRPALAVFATAAMVLASEYLALAANSLYDPMPRRYGDYLAYGAQVAPTTWTLLNAGILVLAAAARLRRLAAV
jgi:hypothetical protein